MVINSLDQQSACMASVLIPASYNYRNSGIYSDSSTIIGSEEDNFQFLLYRGARLRALVITGSNELADWAYNFQILPYTYVSGLGVVRGHRGIVYGGQKLYSNPLIQEILTESDRRALYLLGHSLGGSCALWLGLRAAESSLHTKIAHIAHYGSPTFLDRRAAKILNDKYPGSILRVTSGIDPVAFSSMAVLGYVPVGKHVKLDFRQRMSRLPTPVFLLRNFVQAVLTRGFQPITSHRYSTGYANWCTRACIGSQEVWP